WPRSDGPPRAPRHAQDSQRTHASRQAGRCQTPLRTIVLEETVWTGCLTPPCRQVPDTYLAPRDTSSMGFRTPASGASIADIASPRVPAGPGRPVGARGAPAGGRGRLVARPSRV